MKIGKMQKLSLPMDIDTIENNVVDLERLLGINSLSEKFNDYIVFDLYHSFIKSEVALLAYIFEQFKKAPNSTFKQNFRMRLKSFPKFYDSETFTEYLEKCIAVILLSQIIDNWNDIKDEQAINGKILDLAFIGDADTIFMELSRITPKYYLDLLGYYNQSYFTTINNRRFNSTPLYYEVVFTQKPTVEILKQIVATLEDLMKANSFPKTIEINEHCEVYIDTREARSKGKQLIREKLNSISFLKSTTLNGIDEKFYTLAYQFDFKSIENKISEEMKHHALDKLNNIWISLHVPNELLNELESDRDKETMFRDYIGRLAWLQGLFLFNFSLGSVTELSYMVVS